MRREILFQRMRGVELSGKLDKENIVRLLKNNKSNKKLGENGCKIQFIISESQKQNGEKIDVIYYPASYKVNTKIKGDKIAYFDALLYTYMVLKNQRNNSDHINETKDFMSKEEIRKGIDILLDLFDDLRACISN